MAMSANLGFILGPAIAGILGGTMFGSLLPIFAALLLSMFTLVVIILRLKESKRLSTEIPISEEGSIRKVFAQECKPCYKVQKPKLRVQDAFRVKKKTFFFFFVIFFFFFFLLFYRL